MLAPRRVLVTSSGMHVLARKSVVTVDELLATVDWTKLSTRAPKSRAVLLAIDAGVRAASAEVIVTRPKSYEQKQLAFRTRRAA